MMNWISPVTDSDIDLTFDESSLERAVTRIRKLGAPVTVSDWRLLEHLGDLHWVLLVVDGRVTAGLAGTPSQTHRTVSAVFRHLKTPSS
jgi:hypothetical protein